MCRPDTTIEIKDDELGGVTGFGTSHECRDWTQLMDWTSQWQDYNYEPSPVEAQNPSHHQPHI